MPSSKRPSIATMGLKAYLDNTADIHKGKDYAWFTDALEHMSRAEMAKEMNINATTLDRYALIYNIEKIQHGN